MTFRRLVSVLSTLGISMLLAVTASLPIRTISATQPDLPCDGWSRHTRTLQMICPETVIDGLSGQGIASVGALAFDSAGALYVTRPATGEVLRLSPDTQHTGKFLPPETVATGLAFPNGVACAVMTCFVTTDTQIVRLTDKKALLSDLPPFEMHPLHFGRDQRLWTTGDKSLISVNLDGSDERVSLVWDTPIADFGWTANGRLWATDGDSRISQSDGQSTAEPTVAHIDLPPNSAPMGMTFYPNQSEMAFPQFANGLLVVTTGGWNATALTGYGLSFITFAGDQPGLLQELIPANISQTNSDAALYLLTFFPDHPLAITISPEGWIYMATREGQIVRLRPRNN